MELGIYTFAEMTPDPETGRTVSPRQRLRDLIEEIELADQVGLDVFGVGRAPPSGLRGLHARCRARGCRGTHDDDPAHERGQRAQFRRPGPGLPGLCHARSALRRPGRDHGRSRLVHRVLPAVRLRPRRLRRAVRGEARAPARASLRRAHHVVGEAPGPDTRMSGCIHVRSRTRSRSGSRSVAIPQSAVRAGMLGLPMALAIIGGLPERFAPFAEIHREAARRSGHEPVPALSINSHGYIAETSQQAADDSFGAVRRDDGPDRQGARLAADEPAGLRRLPHPARGELRRHARTR